MSPEYMTNTSEPHADDMLVQAANPVSFDWMVKGVCGLQNVPTMMDEVEAAQPFGSFFAFAELEDLPWWKPPPLPFAKLRQKRMDRLNKLCLLVQILWHQTTMSGEEM